MKYFVEENHLARQFNVEVDKAAKVERQWTMTEGIAELITKLKESRVQ